MYTYGAAKQYCPSVSDIFIHHFQGHVDFNIKSAACLYRLDSDGIGGQIRGGEMNEIDQNESRNHNENRWNRVVWFGFIRMD